MIAGMKVIHLISGAGPMYCGSCMHGNTLAAGLRKEGVDVIVAPLYTPVRTDEENISIDRLSMGGINVYLRESLPLWRWVPSFVRRLLDRPSLVAWAAGRGTKTRPEQLGRLALAMFRGDDGPLKAEVDQLIAWLETESRPDVIHLSNVMLAGLARPLRERLNVPVVATLSGEDTFLDKLPEPYRSQARAELRQRAKDLDALIAMSGYYAEFMAGYLDLPPERIEFIRPGLNLEGHGNRQDRRLDGSEVPFSLRPKTVGFFSRICPDKGLHLLVDALLAVQKSGKFPAFRLRVAGYIDRQDQTYLDDILKRVNASQLKDDFEYVGELDRPGKIDFMQSLDLLCIPTVVRESKGLPVLEALANGVPVVLPNHGAFSELVAATGGGLLHEPNSVTALSATLGRMLTDDAFAAECGRRGRVAVHDCFSSPREARETISLYQKLCSGKR